MPRSTLSTRISISNSRLISSNAAFGLAPQSLAPQSNDQVIDSYSNSLMDELFSDVDRILAGELSDCEPLTKPLSQRAPTPTARIVQSPHLFARSAADVYKGAMAADPVSSSSLPSSSILSSLTPDPYASSSCRTSYVSADGASSADSELGRGQNPSSLELDPSVQPVLESLYPPSPNLGSSFTEAVSQPLQTASTKRWQASLLYLTVGAVGVVIAGVLGLWTASAAFDVRLPLASDAVGEPAVSDADFLTYLQNALEVVSASQPPTAQAVALTPVPILELPPALPTISATAGANGLPQLPGVVAETPNIIKRVLVPIYQNDGSQDDVPANSTSAEAVAALPPVALSAANDLPQLPTVPVLESATATALPPNPPSTGISSIPIVPAGSESLPSPGVDLAVGSAVGPAAALNDVTPTSELTLVGVLNLGDRSAAIFEIDGSSQRAYVGDRIGLSNWTLVSVNGKDVVIRRNDEVRSVYIGQRF